MTVCVIFITRIPWEAVFMTPRLGAGGIMFSGCLYWKMALGWLDGWLLKFHLLISLLPEILI